MADVEREKEFKPIGRLWLHIKILYFLLCLLCVLSIVSLFLIWHTSHVNLDKYTGGLCSPLFHRKKPTGLLRVKRNFAEVKNIEDRGIKRNAQGNARKGMKSRNQSAQSDGDWVWMSSFSRIPVSYFLHGFILFAI